MARVQADGEDNLTIVAFFIYIKLMYSHVFKLMFDDN